MRVLVCGDRHWLDKETIYRRLAMLPEETQVLVGDATGADALAVECCEELGLPVSVFHANWDLHGKAAGPMRNSWMLAKKPDLVLAFHSNLAASKGTADVVRKARKLGINVETEDREGKV